MASTLVRCVGAFWFIFEERGQLPHLQLDNTHSIFALDADKRRGRGGEADAELDYIRGGRVNKYIQIRFLATR